MIINDTIIAPATAVGEGGIAVVRISGPLALEGLKKYFLPTSSIKSFSPRKLYHGILIDQCNEHIDEVMAVYMPAPQTYTCDDVVEIHCHGSQQVVKSILNLYFQYGLRLAEAGEFTYRAYVNGRLDLSQAEAVAQLINAKADSSRKLALSQVEGLLSRALYGFTDSLRNIQILIEAWIDFPEEELPEEELSQICIKINAIISEITVITDSYSSGRVLLEGASILLVGRPNVGKSSLLNALLGEDRAIVTDIPGTTRDLLEEGLTIAGVPVRLVDTAGLRRSDDLIEMEGIRRAEAKFEQADLVLYLVDGSSDVTDEDLYVYDMCREQPAFLIRTKIDLDSVADTSYCHLPGYAISTKNNIGIEKLKEAISGFLLGDHLPNAGSVMLTEQRHFESLISCCQKLKLLIQAIDDGLPLECVVLDLRESLYHLGQISGETTPDSVIAGIFSKFCIGK